MLHGLSGSNQRSTTSHDCRNTVPKYSIPQVLLLLEQQQQQQVAAVMLTPSQGAAAAAPEGPEAHLKHVAAHVHVSDHCLQLLERHSVNKLKNEAGGLGVWVPDDLMQGHDVWATRNQSEDLDFTLQPLLLDWPHDFDNTPLVAFCYVDPFKHLAILALPQLLQDLILVLVTPIYVAHIVPVLLGLLLRCIGIGAGDCA
jgi:hypothetical protein